ncbi:hypothetical protein P12x_005564 [Tundrisphaera lichenicola]|uniref:hypothetical protein n=1 Tax=Tundrisphaera lichenicola TaxID=2029860 RepID=UPI003EBBBB58
MVGLFACPECGLELELQGLSPGREVQCEGCSTWVEVPFLPRKPGPKRGHRPRRRPAWKSKTLRAAVLFASITLLGLAGVSVVGGRVRSGHEVVLAELIASADAAESAGRFGRAFIEIEGAVARARKVDRSTSDRLAGLIVRRDRISILDVRARLAAVDGLEPDRAVGESLTLSDRARSDPALDSLAGPIRAKLDESRLRQAKADLEAARRAFDQGKAAEAFAAADRMHGRADLLPSPEAQRHRDQARALLESVVARHGVAIGPVEGKFVAGSPGTYTEIMDRLWAESLGPRGYLPQPRESPWRALWDEKAPGRAIARVAETQDHYYLQSVNRTTQIDGSLEMSWPGRPTWSNRVVSRTRIPLPNLPAYLAGHLATAGRHNPETERRLHDDAQELFVELASRALRGIPGLRP